MSERRLAELTAAVARLMPTACWRRMRRSIEDHQVLHTLDLSWNGIGDGGAMTILRAFTNPSFECHLRHLNLSFNHMGAPAAQTTARNRIRLVTWPKTTHGKCRLGAGHRMDHGAWCMGQGQSRRWRSRTCS